MADGVFEVATHNTTDPTKTTKISPINSQVWPQMCACKVLRARRATIQLHALQRAASSPGPTASHISVPATKAQQPLLLAKTLLGTHTARSTYKRRSTAREERHQLKEAEIKRLLSPSCSSLPTHTGGTTRPSFRARRTEMVSHKCAHAKPPARASLPLSCTH